MRIVLVANGTVNVAAIVAALAEAPNVTLPFDRRGPRPARAATRPASLRSERPLCCILTWVNRLVRRREKCPDLFGPDGWQWRVYRTSNGYQFTDPKSAANRGFSSKSDFQSGTPIQALISSTASRAPRVLDPITSSTLP